MIGQANGYGDDAGFFFVPDLVAMPVPSTVVLMGLALVVMGVLRGRILT